ncbi:MAG TPA: hypothetical protein VI298_09175 [Geobacteraceae bacterium]
MAINNNTLIKLIDFAKRAFLNNPFRRYSIRNEQRKYLAGCDLDKYDRLVIFFVTGFNAVNGGIMSIISIASETQKLFLNTKTGVFVCPIPGDPPLARFTKFENTQILVSYDDILPYCNKVKSVLLHIPECYVSRIIDRSKMQFGSFRGTLHLNILLQNIDYAPDPEIVNRLKLMGAVTITTAHKAYSGDDTKNRYGCPVHHLSVWVSKEKYIYQDLNKKGKIIVVSPDQHPLRNAILKKIQKQLADFNFIVIRKMKYSQYRSIISEAQFSLTFGEGLDGYFAEPVFSGGIGSAVYNDKFFDEEYRGLPFVYESWEQLSENFACDVLKTIADPKLYAASHMSQFNVLSANYCYDNYKDNIRNFYIHYFNDAD